MVSDYKRIQAQDKKALKNIIHSVNLINVQFGLQQKEEMN